MPARNISRWEAISASLGVSRRIGRKYRDSRIDDSLFDSPRQPGWRPSETGTQAKRQGPSRRSGGGAGLSWRRHRRPPWVILAFPVSSAMSAGGTASVVLVAAHVAFALITGLEIGYRAGSRRWDQTA